MPSFGANSGRILWLTFVLGSVARFCGCIPWLDSVAEFVLSSMTEFYVWFHGCVPWLGFALGSMAAFHGWILWLVWCWVLWLGFMGGFCVEFVAAFHS